MKWKPIERYFKNHNDWVIVQFKEKDTDFYPIPKICEFRIDGWWHNQCDNKNLDYYLNNDCIAVAFIEIPLYRKGVRVEMKRYTHKLKEPEGKCNYFLIPDEDECAEAENKLGQLEDKEEKLGIDLNEFLEELNFVLLNSNETVGYTRKGKRIDADYGYVMDFLKRLKEAMEEELE